MKYSMLLGILALDLEPLYTERAKQRMIKAGSKGGSVTKEQIFAKGKALGPSPYEYSIPKSDLDLEFERVHGSVEIPCKNPKNQARDEVADLYGIAPRQVQRAKSIKEKGIPEHCSC